MAYPAMRELDGAVQSLRQFCQQAQLLEGYAATKSRNIGEHSCNKADDCMPGMEMMLSFQNLRT